MTLQTALAMRRQNDINHTLAAAGRITVADMHAYRELDRQARREDVEEMWAEVRRA